MAIVYFDASALVKLFVEEPGNALAFDLWNGCDAAVASRLAHPEVCAALESAHRSRAITARQRDEARAGWDEYWPAVRAIALDRTVARRAGSLAREHPLSGADAVHLATVPRTRER